jgi:hypothetical protein
MTDTITIIRARRGKRLAKLIRGDGTIADYDSSFTYDFYPRPVANLDDLHRLLLQLLHRQDCAVVRGVPIDPNRCTNVRRLAFPCKKTGEAPTLRPEPHAWAALDLDAVERPDDISPVNLIGCAAAAVQRLPAAFHGARCIVQASASHGIKPGSRLRLWYWLDRFTSDAELKRWLRGVPADPSVFRTVQPIYTAGPVFAAGAIDHLPQRITVMAGRPLVAVPSPAALAPPAPRPAAPLPKPTDAGSGGYAFAALTHAAVRVRDAGVGHRHDTILREARGLARFITAGLLTKSSVTDTLCDSGTDAGKEKDEITSIIAWAIDHPSGAALPSGISR